MYISLILAAQLIEQLIFNIIGHLAMTLHPIQIWYNRTHYKYIIRVSMVNVCNFCINSNYNKNNN